jgi:hypothetical protein
MNQELENLCAERDELIARVERLERDESTDPETLRLTRARLAELLHLLKDVDGTRDF